MFGKRQLTQCGIGSNRRAAVRITHLIAISGVLLILGLSLLLGGQSQTRYASAQAALVEWGSTTSVDYGFCAYTSGCGGWLPIFSPVTPGNVLVVAIYDRVCMDSIVCGSHAGSPPSISVTDNLSSAYSYVTSASTSHFAPFSINYTLYVYIYTATITSAGYDKITVNATGGSSDFVVAYGYLVSGVSASTSQAATGSGTCTSACAISTSAGAAFQPGSSFNLAIIASSGFGDSGFTAGTGFAYHGFVSLGSTGSVTEYSMSLASSPTTFPATLNGAGAWVEAGIALSPPLPTVTETTTLYSTVTSVTTTTETSVSTTTETYVQTSISTTTVTSVPPPVTTTATETTTVTSIPPAQTVTAAAISISCSPPQSGVGRTTKCTATAIAGYPPAGTISFTSSVVGQFGTMKCTTNANMLTCTDPYTPTAAGTQKITATYSNDPTFLTVSASTTINVKR